MNEYCVINQLFRESTNQRNWFMFNRKENSKERENFSEMKKKKTLCPSVLIFETSNYDPQGSNYFYQNLEKAKEKEL